ncbi:hypothetical protein [Phytoactinopolyspora halotolerans]|uniref:Uncharacterized protein n=1 Tax=Phytoactinopolyspora halotolerans TaxID=1981512 RepID=A0A6L9S731_9ACTN|nr:hypothetical protein [Phytoactinopolyspora halotolerans]NEE00869.1 hypothetical protein [Phytoactinopolyspora halotolerans]
MSSLEERVTALESRVDDLAARNGHTAGIAVEAAHDARTARDAHQQNIELLNALRKTQAEHSRALAEHGRMLAEHSERLDSIDGKLGQLTVGVHTIESLLHRLVDEDGTALSDDT